MDDVTERTFESEVCHAIEYATASPLHSRR
jgi:hypothetical protein